VGHKDKLTPTQRIALIEQLPKQTGGVTKGNRPPNTGKIKKPSRNFSDADIARLRGTDKPAPVTNNGTLGDFLKDESGT
jgi:hypothetical protein